MDITQQVLNELAARIGQLHVRLAMVTAERDAAVKEVHELRIAVRKPEGSNDDNR